MAKTLDSADVCIIGSGAGGAVVAYEAARRGLRTLVLERGPRVAPSDLTDSELEMIPWLYADGGLQLNTSMDLFILQGSCVGGSTVLSNMVLLRPDDSVWQNWLRYGAAFDRAALDAAYDSVAQELEASLPKPDNVSRSSRRFMQGALALGLEPKWMLKALGDCRGCGYCNVGCSFGEKRDASTTYLKWAERHGARVLAQAEVLHIDVAHGRARTLTARIGRGREQLTVSAKIVVVAAGAIGSSALLLRSGLRNNIGRRLSFNAGSMVTAEFDERLDGFDADQMTVYLKGPGYIIEATHNPLMSAALTTPGWFAQHANLMSRSRHLAYAGALIATEPVGAVVQSRLFGHEEVRFRMTDRDLGRLRLGLRRIAEIFFSAGARRVVFPTHRYLELQSVDELDRIDGAVRSMRDLTVGSAHPQGGNPISSDPRLGAVDESLRVHGTDNLFVCDASVFPSCIGVNPIHTIMALAKERVAGIVAQA